MAIIMPCGCKFGVRDTTTKEVVKMEEILPCGHIFGQEDGWCCGGSFTTTQEVYEHISGSTDGMDTPHVHYIKQTGSTQHKHPHTGPHVHEREARMEREGGEHVQTGYEEITWPNLR